MAEDDNKKKQRTKLASTLLDKVMQAMLNQLDRPPCQECGFVGANASDINNMLRFLKDNGFSVDKEESEDYLERIVRERKEREATEALKNVQSRPS